MPRIRSNRAILSAVTVMVAALVLGGCSAKKNTANPVGDSSPVRTGNAPSSSTPSLPVVTVNPAGGAADVNPVDPIKVAVTGGSLSSVSLANAEGKAVKGAISADKLSWSSDDDLGYAKSYTVTAIAVSAQGTKTTQTSGFTTVKPTNLTMPYIQTAAGGSIAAGTTFGVGQVVKIHFDESITDRKAAQAAISVVTVPAQTGAFNWLSASDVYWRTKNYLIPGTKVTIAAKAYGKNFGNALYGQADTTTWFKVGPKQVSISDDKTKLISVYRNDKLIRTIPTSMGRNTSIPGDRGPIDLRTNSGPHIVIDNEIKIKMNSASFGLSKGANAYKTVVPVGVKISEDGEYVHWADWSVWAQGNTDTSHGCLNVSPDNAWWFYRFSQPGDIVDVRNTGRPLELTNSGYWTATWAQWVAGGAK